MADTTPETGRLVALEQRQAQVADLLQASNCEQLLLFDRANLHWFCGEPIAHGITDPLEQPAVIVSPVHRFIVCSNIDSQRLFDVYLDNQGFQLKEWPWHQGRDQLLAELNANRKLACDRLVEGAVNVAVQMKQLRLTLDEPAKDRLRTLAMDLAHALEASARNISRGSTEREAAGHLGHRLLHRGIEPVVLHVAGDNRLERESRPGFTSAQINKTCTLVAVGQRDALHATAARSYSYGPVNESHRSDFDLALQISAARQAVMTAGATIQEVFQAGQRVAAAADLEHSWREHPMGHYMGWLPVEQPLLPASEANLQAGQAQCWQVRIRAALVANTYLQVDGIPELLTAPEDWPTRRYQIADQVITLPDVLCR